MVYDMQRDRLLLYGGIDLNDLWSLSIVNVPAVWEPLAPAGAPPPPGWTHTAFYDQERDRMLVFQPTATGVGVWELSLSPLQWRALYPAGMAPGGRSAYTTVFDDQRNRILLYGGVRSSEPPNPVLVPFNDVWAFDLAGDGSWYRPVIAGEDAPRVWGHGAVYDRVRDRMIVCGGLTGSAYGSLTSVTWELRLQGSSPPPMGPLALLVAGQPNPSSRGLGVSFTLPRTGSARIDVLDAAGRRLVSRDVGSLGPGRHVLRIGEGLRIRPGIYFLRLTQGGRTATAKTAVIQ